jgi:hypothetical protein
MGLTVGFHYVTYLSVWWKLNKQIICRLSLSSDIAPYQKICLEDDDKLSVDVHVTLSDILAHHTLFGMQKKLSPLAFPHLKSLDDFMVLSENFINGPCCHPDWLWVDCLLTSRRRLLFRVRVGTGATGYSLEFKNVRMFAINFILWNTVVIFLILTIAEF